jgi:hypothetical protein
MEHVGNYSNWIDTKWIEYMSSTTGLVHPFLDGPYGGNLEKLKEMNYDVKQVRWECYRPEENNLPFNITLPTDIDTGVKCEFWFVKLLPGNQIPMHRDYNIRDDLSIFRYWMPLEDHKLGHVFLYENVLMSDYKAGDLFRYTDSDAMHGVCNLGSFTRYTLNITVYK